jgi:SAM-dependent methyltransferase
LSEREDVSVEWHQGDLADLAFVRADTVDIVLSVYVLGTVPDLDRVFRQVHRVLKPDAPFVISMPHPAWRALGPGDPPAWRRSYWDRSPRPWVEGAETGADHPVTIADLFGSLTRANFRIDTVLEPEPADGATRSSWWQPTMAQVPSTLIVRARKVGT